MSQFLTNWYFLSRTHCTYTDPIAADTYAPHTMKLLYTLAGTLSSCAVMSQQL